MMIEKVITNFSDVSLWAVALVAGYILIITFLLLKLIWKRNRTKTETKSTNQSIAAELVEKKDNTKPKTPAIKNSGLAEYSLIPQKYVDASMQKEIQHFDKIHLIHLTDELRYIDTIIKRLGSPSVGTISRMKHPNQKFYRGGVYVEKRQTGIVKIREGILVNLDGKIYRIRKIDTQHEINRANISLDLEEMTIGGYSLKGKGNRYARLRKSNS